MDQQLSYLTNYPNDGLPLPVRIESKFVSLIEDLQTFKPRDRSEVDRWTQIIITDLEKVHAIFLQMVAK